MHATFIPGDPDRESQLALWHPHGPSGGAERLSPAPQLEGGGHHAESGYIDLVLPVDGHPERVSVQAELVSVASVLDDLVSIGVDEQTASPSMRAAALITRAALGTIARGRLQPGISQQGHDTWYVGPLDDHDRGLQEALQQWIPPVLHCLRVPSEGDLRMTSAAEAVEGIYNAVADSMPRTAAAPSISELPAWAGSTVADMTPLRPYLPDDDQAHSIVVGLRLSLPTVESDPFRITLQVRSAVDSTVVFDADRLWSSTARALDEHTEANLLLTLRRGSRLWPPLESMLNQAEPTGMDLTDAEAMALLGPLANELGSAGIEVLVPSSMLTTLSATAHAEPPPGSGDRPATFDLATACELTWRATLDGEPVTTEELSLLAESSRPLVRMRGKWVVVNPSVIARLGRTDKLSATDALAAALGGTVTIDDEPIVITVGHPITMLADKLRRASHPHEMPEPDGLVATLRPYQRRGLAWLTEMVDLGLGGVLADDMGLGKTIQLIATHLHRASNGPTDPTLVICPAGLIGNWQRELERFAPGLEVIRYHGTERSLDDIDNADFVLTTYGVMRRDADRLALHNWGVVVADEAQQVKNPSSATARALRRIPATARVAMTGTPVENRLTELWSLLDWTTPGLLGTLDRFRRSIAIPVERDGDTVATERFARLIAPFLLRRKKSDPSVLPDLPPKTETAHPVQLTPEQAGLYRAVVEETLESIEQAEGMQRRGLILKLLTGLKQVCNHPAQYLRESGPLSGRSGKLEVFEELVEAITDADDSLLVFTQYVKMGDLLMERLSELGIPAEFLHGSVPLQRRSEMVDRFQDGNFAVFVVSLKAGGTGLNLTKATHVIHYDRWWNPAVEDQASDRIWRIGQDRPVQIHRLISEGTIEDRIDSVLNQKRALADAVVGSGEAWLTEMSNDDLSALVRLGTSED